MVPTTKIKANVKNLCSLANESLIDDISWNKLTSINGKLLYCRLFI
jgi:hypothetical protein